MAVATIETVIANPARRKGKGKMTAKQIKYFGTKRQRAALKARRKRPVAKHRARKNPGEARKVIAGYGSTTMNPRRKRKNAGGQARKVITGYGSTVMNPRRKKRKNAASGKTNVVFNGKRKRKNGAKRRAAKRKNPGAIYALVNPARKGPKKMARTTKKSQRKNPAGFMKKRINKPRSVRRNPGAYGKPMDWLSLGGGAIIGALGATSLPQMVLSGSNSGAIGYLAAAASTGLLAVASQMVMKRNVALTAGIIAGGAGAIIRRILTDYTPVGSLLTQQSSLSGMGDYVANWNFTTPQIIGGPSGNNALGTAGALPVSVAGAVGSGRALMNV